MPTPAMLDLAQLSVLAEIIIRGGDLHDSKANVRQILKNNYRVFSLRYGIYGLSVLVNANPMQPTTYDQLAHRNPIFKKNSAYQLLEPSKARSDAKDMVWCCM